VIAAINGIIGTLTAVAERIMERHDQEDRCPTPNPATM
jgi:hypothetical protein